MSSLILVDNTNPAITYHGNWTPVQGLNTANSTEVAARYAPLYGTIHTATPGNQSSSPSASFNYDFIGDLSSLNRQGSMYSSRLFLLHVR